MAALLSPLAALVHGDAWPQSWSLLAIGSMVYQGVIVTFASYLLWFWLLTRYPATQVQAFVLLTPVFGTLSAGLLLDEPITPALLLALVGICLGLVLLNRRRRSGRPQPELERRQIAHRGVALRLGPCWRGARRRPRGASSACRGADSRLGWFGRAGMKRASSVSAIW